jgi:hypothetical protein
MSIAQQQRSWVPQGGVPGQKRAVPLVSGRHAPARREAAAHPDARHGVRHRV